MWAEAQLADYGGKNMNCPKCGTKMFGRFCVKCGTEVLTSENSNMSSDDGDTKQISLKCKNCNGDMVMNSEKTMLTCPYCGTKVAIVDSDKVAIQKARIEAEHRSKIARLQEQARQEELKAQRKLQEYEQEQKRKNKKAFTIFMAVILTILFFAIFGGAIEGLFWKGLFRVLFS